MCEDFRAICSRKIPRLLKDIGNRSIYIWGAGKGGQIVEDILREKGIPVCGFIDWKAEYIKEYLGYPVKMLAEVSPEKDYLLISLMRHDDTIYDQIRHTEWAGKRKKWFYLHEQEIYNEEDIIYRRCRIGRYTYGYEWLLQEFPFADTIGRFCSINKNAKILVNHTIDTVTTHPMLYSPFAELFKFKEDLLQKYGVYTAETDALIKMDSVNRPVNIGNDVWIGANVSILPGITIGDGAVIGTGAVVTRDVEPYAVMGGVPARLIKYRFSREIREKLLEIKWWDWDIDRIEHNIELFSNPEHFLGHFSKK